MNCESKSCPITLNTTRICAKDAIGMSIEISKIGFANMKPNAVILVNHEEIFDGVAATSLVHFPINAALLFTEGNNLRKETLNEIQRLSPKGYKGIHVILVGKISKNVSSELNYYGYRTFHISGGNHYETACMISGVRKEFKNILIMSGENYSEGIVSGYWSAHHGDPILFVKKDKIPYCTLEVIKKIEGINIYIIGSTETVSKSIEQYLSQLDNVQQLDRIDGKNAYEIAVNFARYKDHKTDFGWGRNYKEGHAFTFGELHHPMEIIAGVLFAHMGKHTPLLITKKDQIPEIVERYINSVKTMPPKDMPRPPFMHGFILGSTKDISYQGQVMIEESLSIDHDMMGMNHMHGSKCMCDSEDMEMHHNMDHENHMMYMKHDQGEEDKEMHSQDHMAGMMHSMHESKCMCDSENMGMHHNMEHEDHMMCMEHDKGKPEGKAMYSQDNIAKYSGSKYVIVNIDEILE